MAFPQHHHLIRLPPPPPPPHAHHASSSGGSSSSGSSGGNSGGGSSSNGGSSGGGGGGGVSNAYPYKMQNMTAYSGLMFLAVGVLIARMFNFFKQHCTKLENSKRQGYLGLSNAKTAVATPFRDNPLRNRKKQQQQPPPSPKHPAIRNVPPKAINIETMKRLQTTGIRMTAHGVHCDPRKVWLTLDEHSINWQSEFQREVPAIHGNRTMVPVRGSLHRINWAMIEYIDVGKRTDALKQATHVAGHLCFSLLTLEGSLDLQANSQLERDTLVSCIGMKLDELLGGEWRQLAAAGGATPSSAGVSSASGAAFSNSSFSTMNQPFADYSVDV
mmetsp:Transcript_442/g.667  ORF Transcript_442/g.667 Transcript_442/m.667 type:complete len:329 (+) Transcript_442:176-1162(+)